MEDEYSLGIAPEYMPLYSDQTFEAVMALMSLMVIATNIDMEKLKTGLEAIGKSEENPK